MSDTKQPLSERLDDLYFDTDSRFPYQWVIDAVRELERQLEYWKDAAQESLVLLSQAREERDALKRELAALRVKP